MLGNKKTLIEQIKQVHVLLKREPSEGFWLFLDPNGDYYAYSYYNEKRPRDQSILIDEFFHHTVVEFISSYGGIEEDYNEKIIEFIELSEWAGNEGYRTREQIKLDCYNKMRSVFSF